MSTKNGTIGNRLREERERLGLKQEEMANLGGVGRGAQLRYEKGEGAPGADYLSALSTRGLDVLYVVCGIRKMHTTASPEQSRLLDAYAAMSRQVRRAALLLMETLASCGLAKPAQDDDPELWRKVARGIPTTPGLNSASRLTAQQWLEVVEGAYAIEMEQQAEPVRATQGQ